MTWKERCSLLRYNSTTAARRFPLRVQSLFTNVILSPAPPLGKVNRYFYRIEFQQRGSPHVHAIFWVDNAHQPNESSEKMSDFVENYTQANIPEDGELCDLVYNLQTYINMNEERRSLSFYFPKIFFLKKIIL